MSTPTPFNEAVRNYDNGSHDREALHAMLADYATRGTIDIPCIINGEERLTGRVFELRNPSKHTEILARVHLATEKEIQEAVSGALEAKQAWAELSPTSRSAIFLRAAELLAGPWRHRINAATMLGQGKTIHQAEIDAACELIDFWRFHAKDIETIQTIQPIHSPAVWNTMEYRPLDGFVLGISPFNFTSIAANLPTAPAFMGNVALWKPANASALACSELMKLLKAAGLPDGVIQFLPGIGSEIGESVFSHPDFSGVHFTGSTETFDHIWKTIGNNISHYNQYPRIVGETGGKDFVLVHESADVDAVVTGLVRGAFEYQGQKCSAASRAYIPSTLWPQVREKMTTEMQKMKMGDVRDFTNFIGPVIDEAACDRLQTAIDEARSSGEIVAGGNVNKSVGWFVEPTVCVVTDAHSPLLTEEFFGPLLTVFVYEPQDWEKTLTLIDTSTRYALTGAIFSTDRAAIEDANKKLRFAAGNFYVNDKPTGAVVGNQPFGGSRKSGTNDKAGSLLNLLRWTSARSIKENLLPPTNWEYPFLDKK
jgi:1-pyrroline-5-carboxylate dehydrogenase